MEMLPYLGYGFAIVAFIYAVVTRKTVQSLNALLAETAVQRKTSVTQVKELESKWQKANKETIDLSAKIAAFEKQKATKEQQLVSLQKQHEVATSDLREKLSRLEDHAQAQQAALTQQLSEAVREKQIAMQELNRLEKNQARISPKQLSDLEAKAEKLLEEEKKLKSELKKALHLIDKQNAVLKSANPKIVKKLHSKISKLETLYTSMKGLRDMSEERNQNWETALRYMAAHIRKQPVDLTSPIGSIVGPALEQLGTELVIDEQQDAEASSQTSVDQAFAGHAESFQNESNTSETI